MLTKYDNGIYYKYMILSLVLNQWWYAILDFWRILWRIFIVSGADLKGRLYSIWLHVHVLGVRQKGMSFTKVQNRVAIIVSIVVFTDQVYRT